MTEPMGERGRQGAAPLGGTMTRAKKAPPLDRYGWHLLPCEAYWSSQPTPEEAEGLASEMDDRSIPCTCGFREALWKNRT